MLLGMCLSGRNELGLTSTADVAPQSLGAESHFPAPAVRASDPILTVQALTQMTTFWTSFMKEPDSIQTDARLANQNRILVSVGERQVSVIKADMPALAAKYPSVAADLQAAGLTAQQEEAHRAALIRVGFTRQAETLARPVTET
jgi:hypothetical protein